MKRPVSSYSDAASLYTTKSGPSAPSRLGRSRQRPQLPDTPSPNPTPEPDDAFENDPPMSMISSSDQGRALKPVTPLRITTTTSELAPSWMEGWAGSRFSMRDGADSHMSSPIGVSKIGRGMTESTRWTTAESVSDGQDNVRSTEFSTYGANLESNRWTAAQSMRDSTHYRSSEYYATDGGRMESGNVYAGEGAIHGKQNKQSPLSPDATYKALSPERPRNYINRYDHVRQMNYKRSLALGTLPWYKRVILGCIPVWALILATVLLIVGLSCGIAVMATLNKGTANAPAASSTASVSTATASARANTATQASTRTTGGAAASPTSGATLPAGATRNFAPLNANQIPSTINVYTAVNGNTHVLMGYRDASVRDADLTASNPTPKSISLFPTVDKVVSINMFSLNNFVYAFVSNTTAIRQLDTGAFTIFSTIGLPAGRKAVSFALFADAVAPLLWVASVDGANANPAVNAFNVLDGSLSTAAFQGLTSAPTALLTDPISSTLYIGDASGALSIADAKTGAQVNRYAGAGSAVISMSLSRSDNALFIATADRKIVQRSSPEMSVGATYTVDGPIPESTGAIGTVPGKLFVASGSSVVEFVVGNTAVAKTFGPLSAAVTTITVSSTPARMYVGTADGNVYEFSI
ncbi:hypothetical protein BJ742DRAFT_155796 [Cladochytrium replicatum]|nr:hypothetical protein BJ742DRAFT_155796 [Cladochytrium replicatum]